MSLPINFELPTTNNSYYKLETGKNQLQPVSDFEIGYQYFTDEGKPVKQRTPFEKTPTDIGKAKDGTQNKIQFFIACLVWNPNTGTIELWQVTQKTIIKAIHDLETTKGWENTMDYALNITKTGEGLTTEYSILPSQPTPQTPEMIEAMKHNTIDIAKWFDGELV